VWSPSMKWSSEFLLRSKQLHRKCYRTLGREIDYRLDILTCNERRTFEVFLAFCSTGFIGNKTFEVTLSYSISSFILLFPDWKL
jgi:hypothetical protein